MKTVRVYDIEWDLDDLEFCNECGGSGITAKDSDGTSLKCETCNGTGYEAAPSLPEEVIVEIGDDADESSAAVDEATDKTGWLIVSCKVEVIK